MTTIDATIPGRPATQRLRARVGRIADTVGLVVLCGLLVALAAVIDIDRVDVFAGAKFPVALRGAALLLVLGMMAVPIQARRWTLPDTLVLAYVSWSALAFVLAPDLGQQWRGERFQFQGMASVVIYAAGYFAARRFVADVGRFHTMLWWLLAAVTFPAVYGVIQGIDADPIWDGLLDGRVFSTIGNPNPLGSVLVLGVPLAVFFACAGRGLQRGVAAAAMAALLAALAFTESRGAFLALGLAFVVSAWQLPRPSRRGIETGLAVVLVSIAVVFAVSPLRDRVSSTWERAVTALDPDDESRRFHTDGWLVTVEMIFDHPLVGVGHERFPDEFPQYRDEVLSADGIARYAPYRLESPHNVPLAIAAAAGVPAALLYLALIVMVVGRMRRSGLDHALSVALVAMVVAHLVASQFVTADLTSSFMFWVLLGSMASMASRAPDIDLT